MKPQHIFLREEETSSSSFGLETMDAREVGARRLTLRWSHLITSFRRYMRALGERIKWKARMRISLNSSKLSPWHILSMLILTAGNIIIPILQIRKSVLRGIIYISFPKVWSRWELEFKLNFMPFHLLFCEDTRNTQKKIVMLFKIFIYLFLAVLGLCCCERTSSSCREQGLLFVAVSWLLVEVASLAAEHGLKGFSRVVARGLSCRGKWI